MMLRGYDEHGMIDAMIITYNEALNLPFCLRSIQGWTKKIFVIDSGSTDGTQQIARSFGAEVVELAWEGYAHQKNWALQNLPFEADWILILDADEVITVKLRQRLESIAARPVDDVSENGFFINRLTYFLGRPGRYGGWFPNYNMRFFKSGQGLYENREVHEHVIIANPVGYIKQIMKHDDRRGLEHYVAKHNRYSTLEAREIFRAMTGNATGDEGVNIPGVTRRRRWLKRYVMPRLPFPETWRFTYMYLMRLGVLDGRVGYQFAKFISTYDYLLSIKLKDMRRQLKAKRAHPIELDVQGNTLAIPEGGDPVVLPASQRLAAAPSPASGTLLIRPLADPASGDGQQLTTQNFLARRLGKLVNPDVRVVVTGGSGFIGTNLVELLRSQGANVINIDKEPPRNPQHLPLWRAVDLLDAGRLRRVVHDFDPEVFIHLAARTDLDDRAGLAGYAANIGGVENLLHALERLRTLRRLIITSTQLVCMPGYRPQHDADYNPHTVYGRSKVQTEQFVRAWKNPPCAWTLVRPTSIWGPWFDVPYRDFFMTVAKRLYVHQKGMNPLRSFGFVGNAVFQYLGYIDADESKIAGKTFYMADYEPVHVRDWANMIQTQMDIRPLREVPLPLLKTVARFGDVARWLGWKDPPITSFRLRNLLTDLYCDMAPVREVLGDAEPYALDDGIKLTVRWLREVGLIPRRTRRAGVSAERPKTPSPTPVG